MRRRRPLVPVEPPAWWRCFVLEDWERPGDGEQRYAAGGRIPPAEVARRRWYEARRRWAVDNDFDVVTYLQERSKMRRIVEGPGRRGH